METFALIPIWFACGMVIGFFAGKHFAVPKAGKMMRMKTKKKPNNFGPK